MLCCGCGSRRNKTKPNRALIQNQCYVMNWSKNALSWFILQIQSQSLSFLLLISRVSQFTQISMGVSFKVSKIGTRFRPKPLQSSQDDDQSQVIKTSFSILGLAILFQKFAFLSFFLWWYFCLWHLFIWVVFLIELRLRACKNWDFFRFWILGFAVLFQTFVFLLLFLLGCFCLWSFFFFILGDFRWI